jgi:hypothetical protein
LLTPDATDRAIAMLADLANLPRIEDLCATLSRAA